MLSIGHTLHANDANVHRAMASGDRHWIGALLRRQALSGVDLIDINASAFGEREAEILSWCAQLAETQLDAPIVLDSGDAQTLCAVAAQCRFPPWLNSFELSGAWPPELDALLARGSEWVLQLRHAATIPQDAATRLRSCELALERVAARGLRTPWIDAVALPWGQDLAAGRALLDFLEQARARWPQLRCLVGLSNISYGHRQRAQIHRLWLPELKARGLAGVLLDPFDPALLALTR